MLSTIHRCDQINPKKGILCRASFSRAWNLKRYLIERHEIEFTTTVSCSPAISSRASNDFIYRSVGPSPSFQASRTHQRDPSRLPNYRIQPQMFSGPTHCTRDHIENGQRLSSEVLQSWSQSGPVLCSRAHYQDQPLNELSRRPGSRVWDHGYPIDEHADAHTDEREQSDIDSRAQVVSQDRVAPIAPESSVPGSSVTEASLSGSSVSRSSASGSSVSGSSASGSSPSGSSVSGSSTCAKRKQSLTGYDRIVRAKVAPAMPEYPVKLPSKAPVQIQAVDWLTAPAKTVFDRYIASSLALWGVSSSHQGTCVLIPEDWKGLDPMDLEAMFDLENCPTAQSTRLRYHYSDQFTSFVRAKAWFQQWPRSGLQLDNFLGTGPFKPMDASHTCHQNCCIAYIAYEPTNTNHDRKACCELAARLRQEGKPIPEHCETHNPPCLLQVSTLNALNRLYSLLLI